MTEDKYQPKRKFSRASPDRISRVERNAKRTGKWNCVIAGFLYLSAAYIIVRVAEWVI